MKEIQTEKLGAGFDEIITGLQSGTSYRLTKDGKVIAHLLPDAPGSTDDAVKTILEVSRRTTLGENLTIRELIEEGRRF